MAIQIPEAQLKEIASDLDCGMTCFYHLKTGDVKSYTDPNQFSSYDFDIWEELIEEIDEHIDEYIRFDVPTGRVSFSFMADFVEDIAHFRTRMKFMDALEKRKPFQQFKNLLHYYPDLLEEWYAYKRKRMIEYVLEVLDSYNSEQVPSSFSGEEE